MHSKGLSIFFLLQAKFGEFPWQVLILTNGNLFVSNGVLIDDRHILSTAHYLTRFSK